MKQQRDFEKGYDAESEFGEDATHAEENKTDVPQAGNLGALITSVNGALAKIATTDALIVDRDRREAVDQVRHPGTYSGHVDELRRLAAKKKRPPEEKENAVLVVRSAKELAAQMTDPIEELRISLGLDKERESLLEFLRHQLDIEHGMQIFRRDAKSKLNLVIQNPAETLDSFPNMTSAEIAMLPLITQTPLTYLYYGSHIDSRELEVKSEDEDAPQVEVFHGDPRKRIPQLAAMSVDGMSFVTDEFNFNGVHDTNIATAGRYLGMTNADDDVEYVAYQQEVKTAVKAMVPLLISGNRLYESMLNGSSESLSVGMGAVSKHVLQELDLWQDGQSVSSHMDEIADDKFAAFTDRRIQILSNIAQSTLYDTVRDKKLTDADNVKVLGVLQKIPACFTGEDPFDGFIVPYGMELRFYDSSSQLVDSVPYTRHHARQILDAFHSEMEDDSQENKTMHELSALLMSMTRGSVLDRQSEDEDSETVSEMERVMFDTWIRHGVVVNGLPKMLIDDLKYDDMHKFGRSDYSTETTMKIGLEELRQYHLTLGLMPRNLLERVAEVTKREANREAISTYITGVFTVGQYSPPSGEVTVFQPPDFGYLECDDPVRAERSLTVLHECGEAIWTMMTEDEQSEWKSFSWKHQHGPANRPDVRKRHFLTWYSSESSKEDFCEHFACYIFHGPEFRGRTGGVPSSSILARKYRFMRDVIQRYSQLSEPVEFGELHPFSIRQINGAVEQQKKTVSEEEALRDIDLKIERENIEASSNLRERVVTLEQADLDGEADARQEESEDDDGGSFWNESAVQTQSTEELLESDEDAKTRFVTETVKARVRHLLEEALGSRDVGDEDEDAFEDALVEVTSVYFDAQGEIGPSERRQIRDALSECELFRGKIRKAVKKVSEGMTKNLLDSFEGI